MYGLLILTCDWADEFDVAGFMLLDESRNGRFIQFKQKYLEFFNKNHTWYFGTNEGWDDDDGFKYKIIEHKQITEEEYNTLNKLFGTSFGQFPWLFDDINDYLYNINADESEMF